MSTLTLIGFSGYGKSGKDTAAAQLVREGWTRRAFAEPLRRVAYDSNLLLPDGRTWAEVYDTVGYDAAKDAVPGFREAMQDIGSAVRTHLGHDAWVRPVLSCMGTTRIVVTDCRFPNEADAIRDRGGLVVRIDRPGVGPARRPDGSVHESETALDDYDFDHRIVNDAAPDKLGTVLAGIVAVHAAA